MYELLKQLTTTTDSQVIYSIAGKPVERGDK